MKGMPVPRPQSMLTSKVSFARSCCGSTCLRVRPSFTLWRCHFVLVISIIMLLCFASGPYATGNQEQNPPLGAELGEVERGILPHLVLIQDQLGNLAHSNSLTLVTQREASQLWIVLESLNADPASTTGNL